MRKIALSIASTLLFLGVFADITVSDVEVFSGYPWKEVVIGYTITGTSGQKFALELMATDKLASKTYTAKTLTGAKLTEGRHVLRWNAAAEGVKLNADNVVFAVSVIYGGVQLWAYGPYWAECNVGASQPEEYGYYFWWGDTVGYKRNTSNDGWVSVNTGSSFAFTSGNCPTDEKDNAALKSAGYIDSTGNLVSKYDAATAHLGTPWRMPTDAEWSALISNCDTTWTTRNGVYGRLVTGKGAYASKSIFLPAAGYSYASGLYDAGSHGEYWSSTPSSRYSFNALLLDFDSGDFGRGGNYRAFGQSVRPLRGTAQ